MKDEEKRVIEDETGATPTEDEVAPNSEKEVTQSEPEAEDAPSAEPTEDEVDAAAPKADEPMAEESAPIPEETQEQPTEKMLTQSQVNELVGRARQEGRDSVMRELYGRYGVSNDEEMNDVFGRGQAYMGLDDEYNATKASMKMLMAENALLKSKIDANRWDDVKAILGTKGYDITPENIEAEIITHPEWRSGYIGGATPTVESADVAAAAAPQAPQQAAEPTVLRRLGSEATVVNPDDGSETEEDKVKKLFGM